MKIGGIQRFALIDYRGKIGTADLRLDAVTVSGGEPTIQRNLERFLETIKGMGYLLKIDTNGSNPDVVEILIRKN
jgi:organic radical activating enzyme